MAIVLNFNGSKIEKTHDKCKKRRTVKTGMSHLRSENKVANNFRCVYFMGLLQARRCAYMFAWMCKMSHKKHGIIFSIIHAIASHNLFDVCISFGNGFLMWAFEFVSTWNRFAFVNEASSKENVYTHRVSIINMNVSVEKFNWEQAIKWTKFGRGVEIKNWDKFNEFMLVSH